MSEPQAPVVVRMRPDIVREIERLAEAEDRTRSDMIRILLKEAMRARRRVAVAEDRN